MKTPCPRWSLHSLAVIKNTWDFDLLGQSLQNSDCGDSWRRLRAGVQKIWTVLCPLYNFISCVPIPYPLWEAHKMPRHLAGKELCCSFSSSMNRKMRSYALDLMANNSFLNWCAPYQSQWTKQSDLSHGRFQFILKQILNLKTFCS